MLYVLLMVYRTEPSSFKYNPAARLPMLDAGARYRATRVRPAPAAPHDGFGPSAPFFDALESGVALDGAWLAQAGLPLPRAVAETCFIVHLERL